MLLNREALLVLDTADTSLTSLSEDLADRLSLPERCREGKNNTLKGYYYGVMVMSEHKTFFLVLDSAFECSVLIHSGLVKRKLI